MNAGNIIGAAILLPFLIASFILPYEAALFFMIAIYLSWVIVLLIHLSTMPNKSCVFCSTLRSDQKKAYRKYHLAIWYSGGAAAFSAILNLFRMAGIIWGGICLWNGFYGIGGGMIAYYFISAFIIAITDPYLYISEAAKKGDDIAQHQYMSLDVVTAKWEDYRSKNFPENS